MAQVKIEMDRGFGWETRGEGDMAITADELYERLPGYAIQYPHRAFLDGALIGEAQRPYGRRGKVRMVRHDGR